MNTFELQDFNKRIGLNTDLKNISEQICSLYDLGNFISNELITIGYEDYNYYLTTTNGKYCVKIFSNIRTRQDIVNYLERIRAVANSQVNAPKPLKINNDIISTNVMLDRSNKVWIIDFAVSNYLPRIIDLAVTSCNMCLDNNSKENTYENIALLVSEYNKYAPLTEYELSAFSTFYKLANAMHILQTQYIIKTDGDSAENQYWLNEGIVGYSFSDDEKFSKILRKN